MFQAVPSPIIRSHNCTYSFRYCQPILLLAAIVDEMELVIILVVLLLAVLVPVLVVLVLVVLVPSHPH